MLRRMGPGRKADAPGALDADWDDWDGHALVQVAHVQRVPVASLQTPHGQALRGQAPHGQL